MVNFNLSEEQQQIRDYAHEFSKREVAPKSKHYDENPEYPWEVLQKA